MLRHSRASTTSDGSSPPIYRPGPRTGWHTLSSRRLGVTSLTARSSTTSPALRTARWCPWRHAVSGAEPCFVAPVLLSEAAQTPTATAWTSGCTSFAALRRCGAATPSLPRPAQPPYSLASVRDLRLPQLKMFHLTLHSACFRSQPTASYPAA